MSDTYNKNILLISSDKKLNEVLANYLSKFGYNLVISNTGADGIQKAKNDSPYSAILITQLLQDIAGSKAIAILKKQGINGKCLLITNTITNADYNSFIKDGADVIYSAPHNLGKILLDIEGASINYVEKSNAPTITSTESPELSLTAEFHFTIRDISETGCKVRSYFPIERDSIIILESKEISDKLSLATNTIFPVRVMNCSVSQNGKGYDLGGVFVGMQEKISKRLKQACTSVKGFKFTTSDQ